MQVIGLSEVNQLISILQHRGYQTVGPTVRDGAIVYDRIASADELPKGWTEDQQPGTYQLRERHDSALFGFTVGPQSWKKFLYPSRLKLFSAARAGKSFVLNSGTNGKPPTRYAFIGVRSCDLHAIAVHDKVFAGTDFKDPNYQALRKDCFIVAINCTEPAGNCFCASMNTGPKAKSGFDLALTEIVGRDSHSFLVEWGSSKGEDVLKEIPSWPAEEKEARSAEKLLHASAENMGRQLDTHNIQELLYGNFDHPEWDKVAKRCLTCANCTLVCPTCFCSTVEDTTDLTGDHAERWRRWDSCFTLDFAKVAGGNFRASPKSRYRQWLTHKLAAWIDQFGTSGCVGCGRCITWCPVGIDITAEVAALRGDEIREPKKVEVDNAN